LFSLALGKDTCMIDDAMCMIQFLEEHPNQFKNGTAN
jgi:hypothetical protein